MIMFILGDGRTAESRRVANAIGGSYERLTHVELLDDFTRGRVLSKRPSTLIVDASLAGVSTTRELGEWLRHVVRYGKVHGVLKGQPVFTIDTPNIIVTGDSVTQLLDLRAKQPYAPIINMGPGYVDTRIRVIGVPDARTRHLRPIDPVDVAVLARMGVDQFSKMYQCNWVDTPSSVDRDKLFHDPSVKLLTDEYRMLVPAAEAALSDLSGLLRDQRCDPDDGSFKYDGQSAHELQAILDKVKSDAVPDA